MKYSILDVRINEAIAIVTINRPEALNALNTQFFKEMDAVIAALSGDSEVKILIITGSGKAFVAGADIAEMVNKTQEEGSAFSRIGQHTFRSLEKMNIPVIAAINGFALGGGLELAMACDFRIASSKAKFGQPEVNLGLIPGYAATQRLSRLTGLGNALYLILTAETITADDALRIGLVQKVTEPELLLEEAMKLATRMANNGSQAVPVSKQVIRKGISMDFKAASEMEAFEFGKQFDRAPTKEGMKAFLEKRKPNWD